MAEGMAFAKRVLTALGKRGLWFGFFVGAMYVLVSVVQPEHGSLLAVALGVGLMLACGLPLWLLRDRDAAD